MTKKRYPANMDEDKILKTSIQYLLGTGWHLAYQTRSIADGAFAGVDAILYHSATQRFRLVEAKGESSSPQARSTAFANCLGTLVKRIKFQTGYLHLETTAALPRSVNFLSGILRDRDERFVSYARRALVAIDTKESRTALFKATDA